MARQIVFNSGGLGANRNVSGKLSVKLAIKGNGIVVPFLKCYTGNVECGVPVVVPSMSLQKDECGPVHVHC